MQHLTHNSGSEDRLTQILSIALVQMRCEKGAIDDNLAAIQASIQAADSRDVDIICFPEMSITGYIDPTQRPEAVLRVDSPEVARFARLTEGTGVTALAGIVETNPAGKPFITQLVASEGWLHGAYRKQTIADDEVQWFAPGADVPVFSHPKALFSIAICADIGNAEVFAARARQGAQVIFEAAAPGLYGPQATRDWRSGYEWWRGECMTKLGQYARDNRVAIAVATQAGRTVDEDFPGGGYVFGPDGSCLATTTDWSAGILYATLALNDREQEEV
jgi:predicted amidohydrolase